MSQVLASSSGRRKVRVVPLHIDRWAVAALEGVEPLGLTLFECGLQPFVAVAPFAVSYHPGRVAAWLAVSAHPIEPFSCNCAASCRRPEQQRDSTGVGLQRQDLFSGRWLQASLFVLIVDELSELVLIKCVALGNLLSVKEQGWGGAGAEFAGGRAVAVDFGGNVWVG